MTDTPDFIPIAKAFSRIGVSVHSVFPDAAIAKVLYEGYSWHVSVGEGMIVIHAVPSRDSLSRKGWEQWFASNDSEPVHQVLFLQKPDAPFYSVLDTSLADVSLMPGVIPQGAWYVVKLESPMGWAFARI